MEKKSSIHDVHKVIQKDFVELHKTLSNKLGDSNPFARFSIGGGFYLWADSRCNWRQMITASSLEQSLVRMALIDTKKSFAEKFGEKTADALFTVPDDSYIYYSNDGDDIEVIIAGWGFKKPVRVTGKADTDKIQIDNPVNISFLHDNQVLTDYEFGIQLPKRVKALKTDSEGVFHFDNLNVGEKFTLVDFATDQRFVLTVLEGQSQYNYDVTVPAKVDIRATLDGAPMLGESVRLLYHGKSYELTTGHDGAAFVELPFHEGESIVATMREQTQSVVINKDGNLICFSFETPKEKKETVIEVSVLADAKPVEGEPVEISYANSVYKGMTNADGLFLCTVDVVDGEECTVMVPHFDPQSRILHEDKDLFVFEKVTESVRFSPYIRIEGDNGFVGSRYPISVIYDGKATEYISDENGIVNLPEMEDGQLMKVIDGLNPSNVCAYKLVPDKKEYVFHVPYESRLIDKDIKVTVLNAGGQPVKCDHVRFQQESSSAELLATLDETGSTFFSKETFKVGHDLTASIIDGDRNYEPITFRIEENEYEYVLQEYGSSPWWLKLIQVLIVAAVIAGSILMWPYLKELIYNAFDLIYN